MKRKITLTSLHLFAKFTPRQACKELPHLFSVKTLTKKAKGRFFEDFSHPNLGVSLVCQKLNEDFGNCAKPRLFLTACQCLSLIGSLHCKGFPPLYPPIAFRG